VRSRFPGPAIVAATVALAAAGPFVVARTAVAAGAPPWPDLSSIPADLEIPPLAHAPPGPGRRVKQTLPSWRGTGVYHVVWLPVDWQPAQRLPVIVEYGGNGGFRNGYGDTCTGLPEDCKLGFGMSAGKGFIWLCLPFLDGKGDSVAITWWGDPPSYDVQPTLDYCREAVAAACRDLGGDPGRVVLCGFSRGGLACNLVGLHDDAMARLWCAFVPYAGYEDVRVQRRYPGADPVKAMARLRRLGDRPQFICQEGAGPEEARRQLSEVLPGGDLTFASTGFRNHSDAWVLRPSAARSQLRAWLEKAVAR